MSTEPRGFRLMGEHERGISAAGSESCSVGVDFEVEHPEALMDFNGTIIGPPHSTHENRIYPIKIFVPNTYPDTAPTFRFIHRVNLPWVDQRTGMVDPTRIPCLSQWKREYTLMTVLTELRRNMSLPQHKKLPQPPEGFSLYRALLLQALHTPLDEPQRKCLQNVIRSRFVRNARIQSPPQIIAALELGYESLQTLKDVASGPSQALQRLSSFITELHLPSTESERSTTSAPENNATSTQPKPGPDVPVVWPWPSVPSVLSRPFPSVTGKRHIPKLVSTMGIPFLRFKKPQSPFLSRVIRDKHKLRQKRYDRMDLLQEHIALAQKEDEWDKLLTTMHGLQKDNANGGRAWVTAPRNALKDVQQQLKADYEKTNVLAVKMFEIVEKEKALAREEDLEKGH